MRFLRRSLTGLFLLSLTVALLALAGQSFRSAVEARLTRETPRPPAQERAYSVDVVPVTQTRITPVLQAFGEIRSRRELQIRTRVTGPVVALGDGFEDGGRVTAGALLLRVDPTDLDDARMLARTALAEAENDKSNARTTVALARDDLTSAEKQSKLRAQALARQRDLAARGVGTEAAVENAALAAAAAEQAVLSRRSALASAEARLAQAENTLEERRIALDEAERRLAETDIRAAFSGTLTDVTAVEGGVLTTNEQVARLIDPDSLEVAFRISTAQYARLVGADGTLVRAPVTVRLDVSGVDIEAKGMIDRDSAEVGEGQTGRLLFATLDTANGLRPGDFVTVEAREPALRGVARLPASALGNTNTVLVLGEGDRLEELPAEVLRRQGDSVIVRAAGLAGREVVAERTPMLGAGIAVKPFRKEMAVQPAQSLRDTTEMVTLDEARRAALIDYVRQAGNLRPAVRERMIERLKKAQVPAKLVRRLEAEMGD